MTNADQLSLLLRLVLAAVLGGAIGWEREHAGKSAGMRTLMLVGLAAALFTVLAVLIQPVAAATTGADYHADPARAVQAVAMGIGFLGAGSVILLRAEHRVRGLTTAASIWATAAIGMASGLGLYLLSIGATVLALVTLHLLPGPDGE